MMRTQKSETPSTDTEKCWNSALNYISRRERSSLEVRDYLIERRGYASETVSEIVQKLISNRWIDDQRLAEILARAEWRKSKGTRTIQQKLKQKGLHLTESELNTILEEDQHTDALKLASHWVRRKYPEYHRDPRERQKAFQGLVRRGFSFDIAKRALSRPPTEGDEESF